MAISKRLSLALVPLGAAALIAGCGGGGTASGPAGSALIPAPAGGNQPQYSGKATLTLYVPARKGHSSVRMPRYISPATTRVDVTVVPAGAASPWPNPISTTVPTPGPVASGVVPTAIPVTMTVPAPLGNAQFKVDTYDQDGYLLSGVTSTPVPISSNVTSNNVTLTLLASAQCIEINHGASPNPGPTGNDVTAYPLENQTVAQSTTFVVTPCDIDGYPIPAGQQLANAITFTEQYPGPPLSHVRRPRNGATPTPSASPTPFIQFSPSVITQGGDTTVTMTYPAAQNMDASAYVVPSPGAPAMWKTVEEDPVYYVLASDATTGTVSGFMQDYRNSLHTAVGPIAVRAGANHMVAGSPLNGCAGGGQAVVVNDSDHSASVITIAAPTLAAPSPLPVVTNTISGLPNGAGAVSLDLACNATIGDAAGNVFGLPQPFAALNSITPAASPLPAAVTGLGTVKGTTYAGLGLAQGLVALPSGTKVGAFQTVDSIAPYDATHFAIAYHDLSGLRFALWDGTSASNMPSPIASAPPTILGMVTDGYDMYAISNSGFYNYSPSNGTATPMAVMSPPPPSLMPRSIAYASSAGYFYVVDGGSNQIQRWTLSGLNAYYETQFPAGTSPKSVVVLP